MSSRRHASTPAKPRKEYAVYKKIQSPSDGEENGAPEFIRIPLDKVARQAIKTPKGTAVRQETPHRRAPASQKRFELPRTPPLSEDDALPSPQTSRRRRSSTPAPHRGTPKKLDARRGKDLVESSPEADGRGSPKERRRKSQLAKGLPRRADGKFASKKNYESEGEYQSEEESSDVESIGYGKKSNKKKPATRGTALKGKAATPRSQRRDPDSLRPQYSESDSSVTVTSELEVFKKEAPKEVVPAAASTSNGNAFLKERRINDEARDTSFALQANRDIIHNIQVVQVAISDSDISFGSGSSLNE